MIEVKYHDEGKGVELIGSGTIYGKEVIQTQSDLRTPNHLSTIQYQIINLENLSKAYLTAEDIEIIAQQDIFVANINPEFTVALVTPGEILQSLAKLWHAYVRDHIKHIKIADQRPELDLWLSQHLNKQHTNQARV